MLCKVKPEGEACPHTFEICLECPVADESLLVASLQRYGMNRVIDEDEGILNIAVVTDRASHRQRQAGHPSGQVGPPSGDDRIATLYFILTVARDQRTDNARRALEVAMKKVTCADLRKLPAMAQIKYVRPFTRFSQRRFGWGDALATKEEVAEAVSEENREVLLTIMPAAKQLIDSGEPEQLPALFDAQRSGLPAALADCRHQFFTENMYTPRVPGPCGACGKAEGESYKQGFTQCVTCESVRCKPCAADYTSEQAQQKSFLRAYHDMKNCHTWSASK